MAISSKLILYSVASTYIQGQEIQGSFEGPHIAARDARRLRHNFWIVLRHGLPSNDNTIIHSH